MTKELPLRPVHRSGRCPAPGRRPPDAKTPHLLHPPPGQRANVRHRSTRRHRHPALTGRRRDTRRRLGQGHDCRRPKQNRNRGQDPRSRRPARECRTSGAPQGHDSRRHVPLVRGGGRRHKQPAVLHGQQQARRQVKRRRRARKARRRRRGRALRVQKEACCLSTGWSSTRSRRGPRLGPAAAAYRP